MKEIKFNKKYYHMIADGLKTQTLRKNQKDLNKGDIVQAIFPGTHKTLTIKIVKTGYRMRHKHCIEDIIENGDAG